MWGHRGCQPPPSGVCQLQPGLPHSTICHLRRCLAVSPLRPSCPSPPLLPVWMNVSSLSPWFSDFHTVRFSVSSRCFLFLNCCCPSFGCMRRHSVSTYASILAGSPVLQFFIEGLEHPQTWISVGDMGPVPWGFQGTVKQLSFGGVIPNPRCSRVNWN